MAALIREHSDRIIAFVLQLLIVVVIALSAEVTRTRLHKELRARPLVLWFTYPTVQKWILGIGFVGCMLLAPLSAMPSGEYEAWIPTATPTTTPTATPTGTVTPPTNLIYLPIVLKGYP